MRIEDHPRALIAILALGLAAALLGAGRTLIIEAHAANAAPLLGLVCGVPTPGVRAADGTPSLQPVIDDGPATMAMLVQLDAVRTGL